MLQNLNNVIIVIDVFRAFTTASYLLAASPHRYFMTNRCAVIENIKKLNTQALLVGKPEPSSKLIYHIPNSPSRASELDVYQKTLLHRTEAGAKGILNALKHQDTQVFAVAFVNAVATVEYLKSFSVGKVTLCPMGHEGVTPTLEDDICAEYMDKIMQGKSFYLEKYTEDIRKEAGKYFFKEDQQQYPVSDFYHCLSLNKFDFAIQAFSEGDYASLECCRIPRVE